MRIGVDACCWANGRGYGRYTRELLTTMVGRARGHEFVCFVDEWTAGRFDLQAQNVRVVPVAMSAAPTEAAAAEGSRSPLDMLRLTRAVWRESPDVFFSPSVYTYFPLPPRLPSVVVVHDAIAERFPELTLPTPRDRWFWRAKVQAAIWQARFVLTVSDFSRGELREMLGVPLDRMRVTNEAPAPEYRPSESRAEIEAAAARVGLPEGARWLTYVGGFNPHKHVDALVRAHGRVAAELGDAAPYLLLVGSVKADVFHQGVETIKREIERQGTGDRVLWTGFVADDDLRHLHSGAVALVLPSACEGFGLPAVEAAACGTPVIATRASPLPALLEGGGIFVRPGSEDDVAAALRVLLSDEPRRQRMGEEARRRAEALSWDHSADVVLRAFREAVV
jgi:glycosyltransferase involved in cell wall biosynthesis